MTVEVPSYPQQGGWYLTIEDGVRVVRKFTQFTDVPSGSFFGPLGDEALMVAMLCCGADGVLCDVCGKNAADMVSRYMVGPSIFLRRVGSMSLCLNCHAGISNVPEHFVSPDEKVQKAIEQYRREVHRQEIIKKQGEQ